MCFYFWDNIYYKLGVEVLYKIETTGITQELTTLLHYVDL